MSWHRDADALAELLLTLADDEFVLGFWDSEWTGIAPMLEEDVAMSSISQDEIGHARAWYELLAGLTDDDADRIAFGREPDAYRHAALMNHPRTDWVTVRRYLYEHADALRLEALMQSSYAPVAELAAKMRRGDLPPAALRCGSSAWPRRAARRARTAGAALDRLWIDAQAVFTPLEGEATLVEAGIMPEPLSALRARWLERITPSLAALGLPEPDASAAPARTGGRDGPMTSPGCTASSRWWPLGGGGHVVAPATTSDPRALAVWAALDEIADPEIPAISLVELGVIGRGGLRGATRAGSG